MRRALCHLLAPTLAALAPPALRAQGETAAALYKAVADYPREQFAETPGENLPEYGVNAFPTAVLIDRRGAVRFISIGVSPAELSRLGDMVEKLVKEPAPGSRQ